MFLKRKSTKEDIFNIQANKWLLIEKKFIVDNFDKVKMETLLKGQEIIAIAIFYEFYPRLFTSGFILKDKPSFSELKEVKKFAKEIIKENNADYVYSECEVCAVRDRFHRFLGFEVEKNLGNFNKWKFRNLKY